MFCKNCGADIPADTEFCPNCGAAVTAAPAPAQNADCTAKARTLMILGIIAAALAELGIPGIILGAIGLKKAKAFVAEFGSTWGMSKAGRILSMVGLILGIIMTIVWTSNLVTLVSLVLSGALDKITISMIF